MISLVRKPEIIAAEDNTVNSFQSERKRPNTQSNPAGDPTYAMPPPPCGLALRQLKKLCTWWLQPRRNRSRICGLHPLKFSLALLKSCAH